MDLEEIFGGLDEIPTIDLTSRTVATLDVLGFKHMIDSVQLPVLARRYKAALAGATRFLAAGEDLEEPEELRRAVVCDRFVFSDTVILVSTDETQDAAEDVLFCSWRMSQFFVGAGLPLRGAVAFGEMYSDRTAQVFLGKALTAAHALEQRQQWIGIAVDNSLVRKYGDLFPDDAQNYMTGIVPPYSVPMKDGTSEVLRTINWRAQLAVDKGIRALLPESTDPSSKEKIANTLAYAAEMRRRGYDLRRPYFHRIAPVVITETPGPESVRHGDEF